MAVEAAYWANDQNSRGWERAIQRLCPSPPSPDPTLLYKLESYPGMLLMYALGIGLVNSGGLQFLNRLFAAPVNPNASDPVYKRALPILFCLSSVLGIQMIADRAGVPESEAYFASRARSVLRSPSRHLIPSDNEYNATFDQLETLISSGFMRWSGLQWDWAPLGQITYRWEEWANQIEEIRLSFANLGSKSPYALSGILGTDVGQCEFNLDRLSNFSLGDSKVKGALVGRHFARSRKP